TRCPRECEVWRRGLLRMDQCPLRCLRLRIFAGIQENVYGRMDGTGRHPSPERAEADDAWLPPVSGIRTRCAIRTKLMTIETKKQVNRIVDKLKKDDALHVNLPHGGKLHMDRPVPFLLVYRIPPGETDTFTSTLGETESAYLVSAAHPEDDITPTVIKCIANTLADKFAGFMLLEVWLADSMDGTTFTIQLNQKSALPIAEKLHNELEAIELSQGRAINAVLERRKNMPAPPCCDALMHNEEARKSGIILIGLEIVPIYINKQTGQPYPLFLRELREGFGRALRKSFFEFVRMQTSYSAVHFQMLGTTELLGLVWEIDDKLAEYNNLFDFLLLV